MYESVSTFRADWNNETNEGFFSRFEKEIKERLENFKDWGLYMDI